MEKLNKLEFRRFRKNLRKFRVVCLRKINNSINLESSKNSISRILFKMSMKRKMLGSVISPNRKNSSNLEP